MVTIEEAKAMAMAFPGAEEKDHFGMPSFRVKNKIFSTLMIPENRMMVSLSPVDQSVFSSFDKSIIYPAPGKWGPKGYTFVELALISPEMLQDALNVAWETNQPKKKRK